MKEIKAVLLDAKTKNSITIKRFKSACFKYGDMSAHSVKIQNENNEIIFSQGYDTRYDGISSKKREWLHFWFEWLQKKFNYNDIVIIDYSENESD